MIGLVLGDHLPPETHPVVWWSLPAGLVLLVTGGIGLHSTYQSGLAITGMALLVLALPHQPENRSCRATGEDADGMRGALLTAPGDA